MKQKVLISSFSGIVQVIINIGLLTLTIPIFINKLGIAGYGIYALITAVGSIGVFTNFGFNTSLIKYLAEQSDHQESNYDITVTFIIIGLATSIIALVALFFDNFVLSSILGLSHGIITHSVRWLYYSCVVANVFQMLSQIPSAILDSQQKVYVTNTVQISIGILSKCMMLFVLFFFPDLAALGWVILLTTIMTFITLSWFSYRAWGQFHCPELYTRLIPVAKKHFAYGRTIYAASLMNFFYEPLTKVLISRSIGLAEVGYFDLALRIRLLVNSVFDKLLYPLFPLIAKISDTFKIREIIKEVQRIIIFILIPVIVLTLFLTKPIITLWIGKNVDLISMSVIAVVISNLISILYQPVYMYLTAKGYPEKTLILQSVNVVINLFLFWSVVPLLNYSGALLAYCVAMVSSISLCAFYQWKYLKCTPMNSNRHLKDVLILTLILFLTNILMNLLFTKEWHLIILLLLANIMITILTVRYLRMIDQNDLSRYIGDKGKIYNVLRFMLTRDHTVSADG